MRWHITWANQILLGKRIPSVMYASVPNSYPWLFHALLAFIHPFFCVFGFDHVQSIFLAYDVVGIITIIWGFVAMYSLGAVLFDGKKTEKALSTFLGIFSGGIGFLAVREPFVIITESAFESYFSFTLGDMIITWPYNASLVFVVPSWPRHLCYVVYLTLIYSLVRLWSSYETKDRREWMIVSGVVLGLTGLIHSTFMMISAPVIIFLILWSLMKEEKRCDLLLTISVAGLVFLPWAGPYLLNSLRFGTTSTTLMSPLDLPPHLIITALGQVSLFSPIGLFFLAKHHMNNGISAKWAVIHLYAVCLAGAVFLANLLPSDLIVLGFLLSRQHRYWFPLYPFLALYATKGLSRIYEKISKLPYHVPIRTFLTAVIIFLGIGSPILTSIGVAQTLSDNAMNREFRVSRPDQLMTAIWKNLTKDAVVATPPSEEWLARYISCFTGAYVVYVDRPKIRWTELEIPSHGERYADLVVLYSKKSSVQDKLDVIRKYGITHIVSGESIDSSLHHLVSEVHLTTFSNQTFYVHCLEPT